MNRILLFLSLLLAPGLALAEGVPETERAAGATETQAQDGASKEEAAASATEKQAQNGRSEEETAAGAAEKQAQTKDGAKVISGMSVLGNQEAPKALVIVPWKSSQLGASLGISTLLDDSRQPVDKEVFMRALSYYEIRSETNP